MRIRWLMGALLLGSIAAAAAGILFLMNPPPKVPAIPSEQAAGPPKPYVIKLHAQWCPVCMLTKGAWSGIQDAYADKVWLLVFDFTNASTTEKSRAEARRLGLVTIFEDYEGETGTVLVVDGTSKAVEHDLRGHRDPADYRAAIDATLTNAPR